MARRRRHHRGRRKRGNWFTRLSAIKKIGICLAGVVVCAAATGVIYVSAKLSEMNIEEIEAEDIISTTEAEISAEGYTNVAVFGVDSRDGSLDAGNRSDSIIIASLNNETKEVRFVSVYRDTLMDIGSGDLEKCNAAYSFGDATQAINMLNRNLDLNIEKYVTADFGAVANIIDLLGGIEIDVKEEEIRYINKYMKEVSASSGKQAIEVTQPGLQTLDGVQATSYSRIRKTAGGDFTRAERQRTVIKEMVKKVQSSSLVTLNSIIDEVMPTIKTNFTLSEILAYASDFMEYSIGDTGGFPFDVSSTTLTGKGSVDIPVTLESNVIKLHEFLYDEEDYTPSSTVLELSQAIQNLVGYRTAEYSTGADDEEEEDTSEGAEDGEGTDVETENHAEAPIITVPGEEE